jgi:hypothetical protein
MLKKLWGDFRSQVAVSMMLSITAAIGTAFVAAMWTYGRTAATAYGAPAAVGAGLVGFLAVIGALNQLQDMDARAQRRRLARRTPHDIEKQIWEWLKRYKYSAQDEPTPGEHFRIVANDKHGVPVTLVMTLERPWVTAVSSIEIDGAAAKVAEQKANFAEAVAIQLIQLGIEYKMTLDEKTKAIKTIDLNRQLVFDEETHALHLLTAIRDIRRATGIVAALLKRAGPVK